MELYLQEMENEAINWLRENCNPATVYVGHSGGKDSVIVHHLAKKAFGHFVPVVHSPKIEGFNKVHEATIDFLYELAFNHGLNMVPGSRMREFLVDRGLDTQVDGTRRDENDRVDRSADVVIDGETVNREQMPRITHNGLFGQTSVFPIVDWSEEDVWKYIGQAGLAVSEEYRILSAH